MENPEEETTPSAAAPADEPTIPPMPTAPTPAAPTPPTPPAGIPLPPIGQTGGPVTGTAPGTPPPPGSPPPFLPPEWHTPAATPAPPPGVGAGMSTATAAPYSPFGPGPQSWAGDIAAPPTPPAASPPRRRGGAWLVLTVAAALIGALIGGGIIAATNSSGSGPTTIRQISTGPALLNGTTTIGSVIAKVLPAIVSIDATSPAPSSGSPFGGFGGIGGGGGSGGGSGDVQEDEGTGMIITPNGEVVTNNHVISGATTITVTLYGKTTSMPATLIDTDPASDIALLQINGASNLPTVTYGNSDDVQVGDAVVAIGNALGLAAGSPTVTQGIISATGRTVQASDSDGSNTETLTNMFQTDAAINPGNSGGPLVDSDGKVIGMNTADAQNDTGTGEAENIGFAIPSNKISQDLPGLRSKSIGSAGQSGSGFLGVQIETLTSQLRSAYNFVPTQGAVVLEVQSGSPADVAGLQEGDVITSLDGKSITSADQLGASIQADKPGQSVKIGLWRGQQQMTVTATLASSSSQQSSS
jgi:serine protease Do